MSVPVMFMEKDVGEILRVSHSETLATTSTKEENKCYMDVEKERQACETKNTNPREYK